VGQFVKGYREPLAKLLRLDGVVECGFVSGVERVMRESHILVLPSIEEGSALVTYEAMASGCALLVSDATGAPVVHGQSGLVHAAGDVDVLTAHFVSMLDNSDLLAKLRRGAIEASSALTWQRAADLLLECYKKALTRERVV
jgi:glycosyltransferase involved in cell wall biosynthesis